ncbi:MAG: hypothetical protein ABUU24_09240 [Variovorax sp.]
MKATRQSRVANISNSSPSEAQNARPPTGTAAVHQYLKDALIHLVVLPAGLFGSILDDQTGIYSFHGVRREKTGGRSKGTPNQVTAEVRALAAEYGEAALRELARLSTEAENETARVAAIRELLRRAYGDGNSVPISIALPDTSTPRGVVEAIAAVVKAVAAGDITPGAGRELASLIEVQRRAIETNDISERLAKLEAERMAA